MPPDPSQPESPDSRRSAGGRRRRRRSAARRGPVDGDESAGVPTEDERRLEALVHAERVLELARVREIITSYASSGLGKAWASALRPLPDPERMRDELAATEEMVALVELERMPLAGLSDVIADLGGNPAAGGGRANRPAEPELLWRTLELLRAAQHVRVVFERHAARFPALASRAEQIEDLKALRDAIVEKVDARDGIRSDASEKLGAIRREIEELRVSLRSRAAGLAAHPELRRALQSEGLTLRSDRYVVAVKEEMRSRVRGRVLDRSQSGSTLYIEPDELRRDGDRLVSLLDAERDEVTVILWDLTKLVRLHLDAVRRVQDQMAWADGTCAKAAYARTFRLTCPTISSDGELELRAARHPFLLWLARDVRSDHRDVDIDRLREKVVPLDVRLDGRGSILVVTGPNTGGKTVALKTIGLTVLMAQSGIPIAAEPGARVPDYSGIFVDIGDEQSLEQSLSTFSSHLKQIVGVLQFADPRSLILLDELGSGTDPLEGAALGRALLDRFRERGWTAIITTHLGSLKEYAYLHDGVENAAMEFDPRTLRPTYRLLLGVPGHSNALAIAERLGVDAEIVARAREEIEGTEAPTRDIITRMERSRRRVEKERRKAERVRRSVQDEKREYEERLEEVEARRESLELEAELHVEEAMRSARDRLRPWIEQLKSVPAAHRDAVDHLLGEMDRLLSTTPLGEKREQFARSLKKGDEVSVPRFRGVGVVRKINKGDRTLSVQLGGFTVDLGFDDISWAHAPVSVEKER